MAVTKITKSYKAEPQQFLASEFSDGDILDIEGSLGHRARVVTIESTGGASVVRFNVISRVMATQEALGNNHIIGSAFFPSPSITEVEEIKPNYTLESGDVQTFSAFSVSDIKIITKSSDMKITVA
jgi:hypothetical protein